MIKRDNRPRAVLLKYDPLPLVVLATRICQNSFDRGDTDLHVSKEKIGPKDKKLLAERVLAQHRRYNPLNPSHESVIEHLSYTFLCRFSRDVLQEIARHRIASISVQSTRACLNRMFKDVCLVDLALLREKFLHQVDPEDVKNDSEMAERINCLNALQLVKAIKEKRAGAPNDAVKYMLPGAFMTEAVFTINARSLRNFLALRSGSAALKEIRTLAFEMLGDIPKEHLFLFVDRVHWKHCPWVYTEDNEASW